MKDLAFETAKRLSMRLWRGKYCCMCGPTYETPAEVQAGRILGYCHKLPIFQAVALIPLIKHCYRCICVWDEYCSRGHCGLQRWNGGIPFLFTAPFFLQQIHKCLRCDGVGIWNISDNEPRSGHVC